MTVTTEAPEASVLHLPRIMPAATIAAALNLAIALGNERRRPWPGYFMQVPEIGNSFRMGQHSCHPPARLLVRPQETAIFQLDMAYRVIQVEWYPNWPKLKDCEHHSHGKAKRQETIAKLAGQLRHILHNV